MRTGFYCRARGGNSTYIFIGATGPLYHVLNELPNVGGQLHKRIREIYQSTT